DHRKVQLNELNELRDHAYENSLIYKEKKRIHDFKIKNRVFNVGDRVLLFNSRLKIFSGKLKTHWSGPFTIAKVFSYGTVELSQANGPNFKVNGHRVKHYFGGDVPQLVDCPDCEVLHALSFVLHQQELHILSFILGIHTTQQYWKRNKKVNEKVCVAQVGCKQCKGPYYTKDYPLKEEGKTLEEAYYTQFGAPFQQGGKYRAAAPGFYQRNNANPSYQERKQSMEESLSKFMSESTKRHEETLN
nr:reverse transcriptase domain-containing protein [Tanacetum cinerariifolium]